MTARRTRRTPFVAAVALVLLGASGGARAQTAAGRSDTASAETLKRDVERRFDVLLLRDGVLLRPRSSASGVKAIEVASGAIAVDGAPMSGAELGQKLGADSGLIIQLSYLNPNELRTLFSPQTIAPAVPEVPASPQSQTGTDLQRSRLGERMARSSGLNGKDRVHIGGDVTVARDEVVRGDVVAIGGTAYIDGEVTGDVVAIGGGVELGPTASVAKDVVTLGGALKRDPGARVGGSVVTGPFGSFGSRGVGSPRSLLRIWAGNVLGATFSLLSTVVRVALLCLLAAVVVLFGRDYVERVSSHAAAEPFKAGAIGFLAQIAFLPLLIATILVLVMTIIGIPLLVLIPFVVVGLLVVAIIGFTAVSYRVGHAVGARVGWSGPYATTVLGILVMLSPILVARLLGVAGGPLVPLAVVLAVAGTIIEYLAWTVGFGAVALVRFAKPGASSAPQHLSPPAPEHPST